MTDFREVLCKNSTYHYNFSPDNGLQIWCWPGHSFCFLFSPVTERVCSAPDCCWRGEETTGKFAGKSTLYWAYFFIKIYSFPIPPEVLFYFFNLCSRCEVFHENHLKFCKGRNVLAQTAVIFKVVLSQILSHQFKNCFLTTSSLPTPHLKITFECCCTFPFSHLGTAIK